MLHKVKGIVLHSINYSETSLIVKIYTDLFGLKSFLVRGIRSKKSKIKPGLFQPLTLLDLVINHKEKSSLQSIKEIHIAYPYQSLPFDIQKSSIALFINELLYKSIREEEKNVELFHFLWNTCIQLDLYDGTVNCFHLVFSIQLTRYLGIMPQKNYSVHRQIFNVKEGHFQSTIPEHSLFLDTEISSALNTIISTPLELSSTLKIKPSARAGLLSTIITYFQYHLPGFREIHSHQVLHSVLS